MVQFTCDRIGCVTGVCVALNESAQQICQGCATGMVHQRFFLKLPDCGEPEVLASLFLGLTTLLTIAALGQYFILFRRRQFVAKIRTTAILGVLLQFCALGYSIGVFAEICAMMIVGLASMTSLTMFMLHFARDALLMPALGMRPARDMKKAKVGNLVLTVIAILGNVIALTVALIGCLTQNWSLYNDGMWSYGPVAISASAGMAYSAFHVHRLVEGIMTGSNSKENENEKMIHTAILRLRRIRSLLCIFIVSISLPVPWILLYPAVGSLPLLWLDPCFITPLVQIGSTLLVGGMAPSKPNQAATTSSTSRQVISVRSN
jgi:hypothetical protein